MPPKLQRVLIFTAVLLLLIPIYRLMQWMQRVMQPRKSFGRLLLYMFTFFALVFVSTFLFVALILRLFPVTKG